MKEKESHVHGHLVVVLVLAQNSIVVFGIPMDRSTYLPLASGAPEVERGWIARARAAPALACAAGIALEPPGYSPPVKPM
jgi:hypothetical protein